jgi:hemoglobin/transferrin/lactoferrin receptor protein
MYKQSLLSASIVLALSSTSAFAEDYALFDEVVVSASRTEQQLEDVAGSVSVVTAEDIDKNMTSDIKSVFDYTPGVSVESDSRHGAQSIKIRGLDGNRVNIIVDGVVQPQAYDSGSSFVQGTRLKTDPEMIKSVEVVKGSASSLYGSDGIAGIVAFETKDPEDFLGEGDDFGGQVKLGYSSKDKQFSENVVLANRNGDVESMLAYTRRDGGQLENFGSTDEDTDYSNDNVLGKLNITLNENHKIGFTGEYNNSVTESYLGDTGMRFGMGRNDITGMTASYLGTVAWDKNVSDDTDKTYRVGFNHEWLLDTLLVDQVDWSVNFLSNEVTAKTIRNGSVSSWMPMDSICRAPRMCTEPTNQDQVDEIKDYLYKEETISFDAQLDKFAMLGGVEHYFIYGVSFSSKDIENTNATIDNISGSTSYTFYQPNATETKFGLFVQDTFTIGALTITPGIRYDSFETDPDTNTTGIPDLTFDKHSSDALTGRLGAIYSLNNEMNIYGQVSQGFRAPSFKELFYAYEGGSYATLPNPDLEAEESITYETGIRYTNDYSKSSFGIFYSDYDNFIDSQTTYNNTELPDGETKNVNIAKATIKGFEVSNTLLLDELISAPKGMSTNLVAAYTEGEDGDGKALNSVNPWNAVVALNYDAPSANWGTSLKVNYTAKKSSSDINFDEVADQAGLPSATVVDLTAYIVPMKDLTIRGGIFNITNEEYYSWNDVRGNTELDRDETQAERNYSITAKYEF